MYLQGLILGTLNSLAQVSTYRVVRVPLNKLLVPANVGYYDHHDAFYTLGSFPNWIY